MTEMKNSEVKSTFISNKNELDRAFEVRKIVFVDEQKVSREDEFDEFEDTARHFLAKIGDEAVGAARWRRTEKGIKLERFAVLKHYRGRGVGESLVNAVMKDVNDQEENPKGKCYMHAQLSAIPFYEKLGFTAVGDEFDECNIMHRIMVY